MSAEGRKRMQRKLLEHADAPSLKRARAVVHFVRSFLDPFPYRRYTVRHRCIFVHIPKCAGTSVLAALGYAGRRDHCTYREYLKANRSRFEKYYKFSVVRDPVNRFVSTYRYLRAGGNQTTDRAMSKLVGERCPSVVDFIEFMRSRHLVSLWPMLWPQSTYIADESGTIVVDKVLRTDSLERDFDEVAKRLKLTGTLDVVNATPGGSAPATIERPGAEVLERFVREAYAMDYEIIGF